MAKRELPHDRRAEQCVLSSILLENELFARVRAVLTPDSFYTPEHAAVFQAMETMLARGQVVDIVTLQNELRDKSIINAIGGPEYLYEILSALSDAMSTTARVEHYASIVADHARRRAVIAEAKRLMGAAYGKDPVDDLERAATNVARAAGRRTKDAWTKDFLLSKSGDTAGQVKEHSFYNLCLVLQNATHITGGKLRYNEMTLYPTVNGENVLEPQLGNWRFRIEREYGFNASHKDLQLALVTVSAEDSYHPVREYLNGLKWDGVARIDRVVREILHVPNPTPLEEIIMRRWFISAVARPLNPGCQLDTALVLLGDPGRRKNTFFRTLADPWVSETKMDINNKDAFLQLAAVWIFHWGEIDNITTHHQASEIKSFTTVREDKFRAPYRPTMQVIKRASIIVGSTNKEEFLVDEHGDRRFWVVRVSKEVNYELLAQWRDQLWAEAVTLFRAKEIYYLDKDQEAQLAAINEDYKRHDPWDDIVASWLAHPGQKNLEEFQLAEVMAGALRMDPKDMHAGISGRLGAVMRRLGFTRTKKNIVRAGVKFENVRVWVPKFTRY